MNCSTNQILIDMELNQIYSLDIYEMDLWVEIIDFNASTGMNLQKKKK